MIDILLTTYNRLDFLKRTLDGIFTKTREIPYRLFIIDDCSTDETPRFLMDLKHGNLFHVELNKKRSGIRYGFNTLWDEVEKCDSLCEPFPFMCYFQDDVEILEDDWLITLLGAYGELHEKHNIGFFSGYDCVEHPNINTIKWNGSTVLLKASTGFPNVIAEKDFWRSIGKVPLSNPDGKPIGFPSDGKGSNLDVWFTGCYSQSRVDKGAAAPNCAYYQKKKVMVIPMMRHLGQDGNSTWDPKRMAK